MEPLILKMQNDNLITDYTNTAPLTYKQSVSLSLTNFAINKRLYFTSGYNLNLEHITGLSLAAADTLAKDPNNGKAVLTADNYAFGTLFIFNQSNQNILTFPLADLVTSSNNGKTLRLDLSGLNIGSCYVLFSSTNSGTITTANSLPFTFYFD